MDQGATRWVIHECRTVKQTSFLDTHTEATKSGLGVRLKLSSGIGVYYATQYKSHSTPRYFITTLYYCQAWAVGWLDGWSGSLYQATAYVQCAPVQPIRLCHGNLNRISNPASWGAVYMVFQWPKKHFFLRLMHAIYISNRLSRPCIQYKVHLLLFVCVSFLSEALSQWL